MSFSIDLRSDTVTRPCAAMRQAIAQAEVGDDVLGDDPTTRQLEETVAELLGKEAALFVASGTMSNQIAVRLHCARDEEFLCEAGCHIINYEQAGYAQLSGVAARALAGTGGVLSLEQIQQSVHGDNEHLTPTSMIALENTHNRAGGLVQPIESLDAICSWAHSAGLSTHLDGARLFNAVAASGLDAKRWVTGFDSVSVCFSKGLGAPVGSALIGPRDFIRRARRVRKLFGGGMRQSGLLAAAAVYALKHNRDRMVDDHQHAQRLAEAIADCPKLTLATPPETNIIVFQVAESLGSEQDFCDALAIRDVGALPFGPGLVRLVTHLDVDATQISLACQAISEASGVQV